MMAAMTLVNAASFSDYRQLLIFGKEQHEILVKAQLNLLEEVKPGMDERDIKITVVDKQSSLYRRYKLTPAVFTVILVGKDDTEKFRTNQLLLPAQLFALIDGMPMRKQEMQKNNLKVKQ